MHDVCKVSKAHQVWTHPGASRGHEDALVAQNVDALTKASL
jgi:hypothetical protein